MGTAAIGSSAIGAIMARPLARRQIARYLAAARSATDSPLVLNSGSLVPDLEET